MKIEKVTTPAVKRELLGVITESGTLMLRFKSSFALTQNTVSINAYYDGQHPHVVKTNGTGEIDGMTGTKIYKGDTITITF
jgi:hypothetical protein